MDWGAILLAAFGGGAVVELIRAIANRGKVKAESEKIAADCIKSLGEAYEARLLALNTQVTKLDAKVATLD